MRHAVRWLATTLTRLLLWGYPSSFRRNVGGALLGDVERRAGELPAPRLPLWLVRLTLSHLLNAGAAWARLVPASISTLDLKLAFRLLAKYPGLTVTSGLGLTAGVTIVVGFFALFYPRFHPRIPLDEGDRLVGLQNWDQRTGQTDHRASYDFGIWQSEMTSIQNLSAFRTVSRNLIAGDGSVDVTDVAEITPSGFRLARVPPLLGRGLVETDIAPGASPVVVIGFDLWRSRFSSDPGIVGRTLRLGRTVHTIVGVMPQGFAFPVNHRVWVPLALRASDYAPGDGPSIFVSGRLAPGFDLDDANAEVEAIGTRLAAAFPDVNGHLRPEVVPYTYQFFGGNRHSGDALWPATALVTLLLVVVAVNVGILIYARTATRLGEIAVRTALGASRRRIVAQLVAESLMLSAGATALGLVFVTMALAWARGSIQSLGDSTFWTAYAMTGPAVLYAVALALLVAFITGVVPALRATGKHVQSDLRITNRGAGLRMGRTWTTLIVVQVAVASAGLPIAVALGWFQIRDAFRVPNFAVDETAFANVQLDSDRPAAASEGSEGASVSFARLGQALSQRLDAEPGIVAHSFTVNLPLNRRTALVSLDAGSPAADDASPHRIVRSTVDPAFFHTVGIGLLAGRAFVTGDRADSPVHPVVVNRAFVDRLLGGGDALGRRLRYVSDAPGERVIDARPWHEIVGVVEDLEANPIAEGLVDPCVYQPMRGSHVTGSGLAIRLAVPEDRALARRLPAIAAALDPALRVSVVPVRQSYATLRKILDTSALALGVALLSVILLAAAGIYALMAFTVARRRHEIALRAALGAEPRRLLRGIFGQAARQIAGGVVIGISLALLIDRAAANDGGALAGRAGLLLSSTVVLMTAVGIAAALGPARRGLRIQPLEALKDD